MHRSGGCDARGIRGAGARGEASQSAPRRLPFAARDRRATERGSRFASTSPSPTRSTRSIPRAATASVSCAPSSCSTAGRPAGRGDAISGLSPARGMGAGPAGDDPHARRRRRQADSRADAGRRNQSVSRRCAASGCRSPSPSRFARSCGRSAAPRRMARSRRCCRWWPCRRTRGRARAISKRLAEPRAEGVRIRRPELGIMVEVPAAAHCGRGVRRRVLLDRLERSDPICHGRRRATATRSPISTIPAIPRCCA